MMTQKECVFVCVMTVLELMGVDYDTTVKYLDFFKLNPTELAKVHGLVVGMFMEKKVALNKDWSEEQITKYVPGLVNNHLRKDKRLNSNTEYVAANPGRNAGATSPEIRNLRNMLKLVKGNAAAEAKVQAELEKKIANHQNEKLKAIEVDITKLDPEMIALYEATMKAEVEKQNAEGKKYEISDEEEAA